MWNFLAAAALLTTQAAAARDFAVPVPQGWRNAQRLMLLVNDVSLPKNKPVIFEIYASHDGGQRLRLGTYGVVAESENATGRWEFEVFRVNVTRPLRRWLAARPKATTMRIRLEPVDGSGQPIEDLDWSVRSVEVKAIGAP